MRWLRRFIHSPSCSHDGYQWRPLFSLGSPPFILWISNHIQQGSPPPPTQETEPYLNPAALINLADFVNYLFGWLCGGTTPLWCIWGVSSEWNNGASRLEDSSFSVYCSSAKGKTSIKTFFRGLNTTLLRSPENSRVTCLILFFNLEPFLLFTVQQGANVKSRWLVTNCCFLFPPVPNWHRERRRCFRTNKKVYLVLSNNSPAPRCSTSQKVPQSKSSFWREII